VARGLAELLVGGDDVEHVVHDLERHAVEPAELREAVDVGALEPTDDPPDAACGGEQGGGLALDRREVRGLGATGVERRAQLVHLALAQAADRGREQAGDLGAQPGGDLRGLREEEVAREDGPQVAPPGVDALGAATGGCLVDDVVVAERSHLHELHRHTAQDHLLGDGGLHLGRGDGRRRGRGHGEQRPLPLAPRFDQVAAHLGHQLVLGRDSP
jgi:hypothetical protein